MKFFLKQRFQVDAIDGSKELCKLACEYTGIIYISSKYGDFEGQREGRYLRI